MGRPSTMPQIFASPLMRRYYAPLVSSAYFSRFVAAAMTLVIPFIISYTISPFWLKESTFTEQGTVNFKHQAIIMLEGSTPGSEIIWSTYDQLNAMVGTKYRVAEVQAREDDINRDGKVDEIYFNARFPLKSGESVNHARFIMFFDWAVNDKVRLAMETAAYYDHTSGVSGSQLELWADLGLRQRSTLPQSNDVRI